MPKIEIDQDELIEHYDLLERLNSLLHQPLHFDDIEYMQKASTEIYPDLHKAYYKTVWDWLPAYVQQKLSNR